MSNTPESPQHCRATRRDGTPCGGKPLADGLCFAHQASAPANRAKGGRHRGNAARSLKVMPERLRPVADMLASALEEVHSGELDPRAASAMAALASALVKVVSAGEYEQRIQALERVVTTERTGRPA